MCMTKGLKQYLTATTHEDLDAAYEALLQSFATDPDLPDDADFQSGLEKMMADMGYPTVQQRRNEIDAA